MQISENWRHFDSIHTILWIQDDDSYKFVAMSSIKIRKAKVEDVPALHNLILELAEFEDGLNFVSITKDDLIRDGFRENALFEAIVAERDNEIAGTAIYYFTYSTWSGKCLYLEDLIVKRNIRSNGIGSSLMKEVIRIAKRSGSKRMAWQVLNWNVDACDFYRKFGASLDDEWLNGRLSESQINSFSDL